MIQALQIHEYRGLDILDVMLSLEERLRQVAWPCLKTTAIYQSMVENGLSYVVVSGLWFRKFLGHVAVEHDMLIDMRRTYPPITDKDLIFIKNYE